MQLLICTAILFLLIATGTALRLSPRAKARAGNSALPSHLAKPAISSASALGALLIALVFSSNQKAAAQTAAAVTSDTIGVCVYFPQGYSTVQPSYRDNGKHLREFVERIDLMHRDPAVRLTSIDIISYASPEGSYTLNMRLVRKRAANVASYLKRQMPYLPADLCKVEPKGIDWTGLTRMVEESEMQYRAQVLNILRNTPERTYRNGRLIDSRLKQLMELRGGVPYWYMFENFFPTLRAAGAYVVCNYERETAPADDTAELTAPYIEPDPLPGEENNIDASGTTAEAANSYIEETVIFETVGSPEEAPAPLGFHRYGYVKTNIPAYGMLWLNAAIEFDLAEHWSAQLPIYYSGWNYFTSRRKFRTFAIQPEIRWWPTSGDNRGFFVGAHFGMAYYNAAFGGDFRYQDHKGTTPALGGGVSVGARIPLSANRRWWLEFSVGAGIYRLDYDRFINAHNGLLFDRRKRTFYGIDNAAISIAYRFSLERKQKGGEQ